MDFFQLECFAAVARCLSFSEASEELSISQSSVSKHIAKLEEELDAPLFDRSRRQIALTRAGEQFLVHTETLLLEYTKMQSAMQGFARKTILKIGCVENFGKAGLSIPFTGYMEKYPNIRLSIVSKNTLALVDDLLRGKYPLAIIVVVAGVTGESSLDKYDLSEYDRITLHEDQYMAVVNRADPLSARPVLHWLDLADRNLMTFDETYTLHHYILQAMRLSGLTPRISFESNFVDNLEDMVVNNAGITFLPPGFAKDPSTVSIPMDPPLKRVLTILVKKSERQKSIDRLIDTVKNFYTE